MPKSPQQSPSRARKIPPSSSRRPVAVAITGAIGAGKSEMLRAFARQGAATISSDEIVHRLLRENETVKTAIVERLTPAVLDEEGEIDRGRVAQRVFHDREALQWLEGLLHPPVVTTYLNWREELGALADPPAVCVTEVPLLYEVGGDAQFDAVVVVTAPPEVRAARLGRSVSDREDRLIPEEEKIARADFVVENAGPVDELDAAASDVIRRLTEEG